MSAPAGTTFKPARKLGRSLLAGGIVSGVAVATGAFVVPQQFAFSYLSAFLFFFTITAGALFWVIVHHAAGSVWSVVVRRQMENIAALLGVLAIIFIPIVFVASLLWNWMDVPSDTVMQAHSSHVEQASRLLSQQAGSRDGRPTSLLDAKRPFLTPWFFWARAAIYLLFFSGTAIGLRALSIRQDRDGSARWSLLCRRLSLACLPVFGFSITFAAIDWLMGLDYRWFSTIWGVYLFAGSALGGLCALVLVVTALRRAGYFEGIVSSEHYHILGKLLLAFTIFWAYIAYSQYMLIWYADIPEETVYFVIRSSGSWRLAGFLLLLGHFLVPFLLLLPAAGKRKPAFLCAVAVWLLAMHFLDLYVIVIPVLHPSGVHLSWLDPACFAFVGFVLASAFLRLLGNSALWPLRDPRLGASINLKN